MVARSCCVFVFRGRDVRPAAHLLSFASPKESRQRKGEPWCLRPPSPFGRRGQPAVLGGKARLRNSLRAGALRSDNRSQSDHEAGVSFGTPARLASCAPRRSHEGGVQHTGHCFARPGVRECVAPRTVFSGRSAGAFCRAQRWPWGRATRRPGSLPSGCAWGAQGVGWRTCRRTRPLRELTCRGCPSVARQRAASSTAHPTPEHPRLPRSPCGRTGSHPAGSPFFWLLFFGEAKKSSSPAGARPGPRP